MTDFANLGIRIDSTQAKAAANDLDTLTTAGTRAETQTKKLAGAVDLATRSIGQKRAGVQQLGFQFGDFTTQVSSGTSVVQAFAQNIGQASQALQLMGGGQGALGKVAAFLGTGWGIAFTAALPLLGVFVSKLFESEDAAKKSDKANISLADALGKVKFATDEGRKAVEDYNKQQQKARDNAEINIKFNLASAEARLKDVLATRAQLAAELDRANAFKFSPAVLQSGPDAIIIANSALGEVRAAIAANQAAIAIASQAARNLRIKDAAREAAAAVDPIKAINNLYDDQSDKAIKAAEANDRLSKSLTGTLTAIEQRRKVALDAEREASRKDKKDGTGFSAVTGAEVARLLGTTINPGGGTRSAAQNAAAKGAANSYHLVGQAIDIPLTVNGKPLTKEGIRASLAQAGVIIKELLGPSDKNHSDHFHVAFDKKRAGPDEIARDQVQAAKAAAQEYDKLVNRSEAFRDSLIGQVDKLTLAASAILAAKVAAEIAVAPTAELARQIGNAGDEAVRLLKIEEATRAAREGAAKGAKDFADAARAASKAREDQFRREQKSAEDYARRLDDLVGIIDQFGGSKLGKIASVLSGFATGDFSRAGGPIGAILNVLSQGDSGKAVLDKFTGKLDVLFGGSGQFKKTLQGVLGGAGTGAAAASAFGGSPKAGAAIGALLSALGASNPAIAAAIALNSAANKLLGNDQIKGGKIFGLLSPLGTAAFGKALKGSATLGFGADGLGVSSTSGNSNSRQKAASALGTNISGALGNIADQLGGTLDGPISVSIGIRKDQFRVDPTGKGATSQKKGAIDFGKDQAAAFKFALADAIKDGAISGLSAGVSALLNRVGGDIEKQLAKAIKFQSVFDQLKERTDPLGFAMEQLGREAESLKKIFAEAGAGASEYAQLEQLLALKRADAAKDAGGAANALKAFLLDLNAGPASPLSLGRQKIEAEAALAPFSAAIASAQAARAQADAIKASGGSASAIGAAEQAARIASGKIDQDGFQSAAQRLLGISRGIDGSGAGFFAEFDRIRALTQAGIGLIDRPQDLTPQIAQNTADTANLMVDNNELLKTISAQLQAMNDNGSIPPGWFDATRSFA